MFDAISSSRLEPFLDKPIRLVKVRLWNVSFIRQFKFWSSWDFFGVSLCIFLIYHLRYSVHLTSLQFGRSEIIVLEFNINIMIFL